MGQLLKRLSWEEGDRGSDDRGPRLRRRSLPQGRLTTREGPGAEQASLGLPQMEARRSRKGRNGVVLSRVAGERDDVAVCGRSTERDASSDRRKRDEPRVSGLSLGLS